MERTAIQVSQAQRRRLVERWRSSGLSARDFAAGEGINVSRLWAWSSRMRREMTAAAGVSMTRAVGPTPPKMLPVRITTSADARYEVVTTDGRIVRASGDFDPLTLARLAAALEVGC